MLESGPGSQKSSTKLGAGAIASLTGAGVLVIFIVQNTEDVKFDFLWLSFHVAAVALHDRDGVVRRAGVVWVRGDAPAPAPQGTSVVMRIYRCCPMLQPRHEGGF